MNKTWKKIAAVIAVACLALCGVLFAACGGDGDEQADYTVSVTYQSGRVVPDLKVIFTPESEGKEAAEGMTDADGKFTVRLYTETNYAVTAENLPEDFILQTKQIYTSKEADLQLKIVLPETYSFEVTGPEGADFSGITVSYSPTVTGEKVPLGQTDANGRLTAKMEPTVGYAFITPPAGYVYNEKYTDNTYKLNSRLTTKFKLIGFEELALETPMTDGEINTFRDETENTVFQEMMESSIRKAYSFSKTSASAEANRVYSFRAKETGEYWVFINYSGDFTMSATDSLNLDYALNSTSGSFKHFSVLCEEGETYYLNLEADTSAQNFQFLIVSPKESNETLVTSVGDVALSIREKLPAEIKFMPDKAGEYTFATSTAQVKIEAIANSVTVGSSENGTLKLEVTSGNLYYGDGTPSNAFWLVRFTSLDEAPVYPLNISVQISREDLIEYTTEIRTVAVTEKLSKYADQSGTLTAVGVNGTDGQIVKGGDGYYHFGSETGAVVVVKLKGKIDPFYPENDFEKLDESSDFYRFHVSTDEEKHIYHYDNYAKFLRGYLAYGDEKNASGEYYLKYVNSDGVYPLTDKLVTFLKLVADNNGSFFKTCVNAYTEDSLWLFSAFYYAD